jgi:hypothetical protein
VLLPSSAREGALSPVTEVWLAVVFGAATVVSSLQSAGLPLFDFLINPFYNQMTQQVWRACVGVCVAAARRRAALQGLLLLPLQRVQAWVWLLQSLPEAAHIAASCPPLPPPLPPVRVYVTHGARLHVTHTHTRAQDVLDAAPIAGLFLLTLLIHEAGHRRVVVTGCVFLLRASLHDSHWPVCLVSTKACVRMCCCKVVTTAPLPTCMHSPPPP